MDYIKGQTISCVVKVKQLIESKDVENKQNKKFLMSKFLVNDGFKEIPFVIFGWFGTTIKVGDMLDLKNVYVNEFREEIYLTLGKHGSCDILKGVGKNE